MDKINWDMFDTKKVVPTLELIIEQLEAKSAKLQETDREFTEPLTIAMRLDTFAGILSRLHDPYGCQNYKFSFTSFFKDLETAKEILEEK